MEKRLITIDFDDVIVDTQKYQCDLTEKMFNVKLDISNSKRVQHVPKYLTNEQYIQIIDALYSSTEIPLVKGFKKYLEQIQELGYNPKIVTSRGHKESEIASQICEKHKINIPLLNSNYKSKIKYCKESIVHIDDSIWDLKQLNGVVENLLLFDKPHNKNVKLDSNIIRMNSWENIYDFLK